MANIIDYLQWRGDVPMRAVPFTEVDALVLSTLVYMPLGDVAGEGFSGSMTVKEAANVLRERDAGTGFPSDGERDQALLDALAVSERFGDMRIAGFVDRYDADRQEQFAAAAFLNGDEVIVVYRGTDATIVGWKEDFNMSFETQVPAQKSAVEYAENVYRAFLCPMRLCGHSKGGNLAAYAALFSSDETREHILTAYSFDGPGFNETVSASRACAESSRIRTFVPQGSIVGMMFWHSEPFTVVRSDGVVIFQHDPYTWQILGPAFVPAEHSISSRYADATFKTWLTDLPVETRRMAIDGIFEVLSSPGGKDMQDLLDGKSVLTALKTAGNLDPQTRAAIKQMLVLLGSAAKSEAADTIAEAAGRLSEGVSQSIAGAIEEGKQRITRESPAKADA